MARLTEEKREQILSDYHIGKSQNFLAKKYEVSPATINKLCKGLKPKYKEKVNTVASIKKELYEESEYQSECFEKEVNRLTKDKELIHKMTKLNLKDLSEKYDDGLPTTSDNKNAQDTIDRASVTLGVNPRFAPKTEITNTNTTQNNLTAVEISKAVADGLPD